MKQQVVIKKADNFDKNQGKFLYDNKSDEMMCNVLELFPNKKSFLLQGAKGSERKKELQKKVRTAFNNEIEGIEEYENAGGRGRRRIRDAFNKIGRTLATAGLAPARGAALALIRLNFRASASKLNLLEGQGREKLEAKWERLGGNKTKLRKAIDAGKGKKMLVCGKKCRAKAGKNPQLPSAEADDFVNAVETGVTAALIAAGGGVIAGLLKITDTSIEANKQKELLQLNAELNQADAEENAVDATMTPQERKIAEEIIKAQNSGFDPIQAIQNNPNLTADEKAAAIAEINESLGGDDNKKKILYFAVGAIVFVGLGYLIYKLSNKSE
jgi:rRNA processing protein Krr1/Pno1